MEFTPQFFDEASKAWRANKVPIGNGSFRYKKNAFTSRKPAKKQIKGLRRSPRLKALAKKKLF